MTVHDAKAVAQQLGEFDSTSDRITAEIRRLNRQKIVTLKQVDFLHQWLEGKRQAKQSCRDNYHQLGQRSRGIFIR